MDASLTNETPPTLLLGFVYIKDSLREPFTREWRCEDLIGSLLFSTFVLIKERRRGRKRAVLK